MDFRLSVVILIIEKVRIHNRTFLKKPENHAAAEAATAVAAADTTANSK